MSTLVIQPSFRALGQMQVKWQTFEKPENKRQMYGRQAWVDPMPYICPSTQLCQICPCVPIPIGVCYLRFFVWLGIELLAMSGSGVKLVQ